MADPKSSSRLRIGTMDQTAHPQVVQAFRQVEASLDRLHAHSDLHTAQLAQAAHVADLHQATTRITGLEQQVANLLNQIQAIRTKYPYP